MPENTAKHSNPAVEADVLSSLRAGPLRLADCQSLRIAPTTLKTAIWSLRLKGHKIEAEREPVGMRRNVYTLVEDEEPCGTCPDGVPANLPPEGWTCPECDADWGGDGAD